MSIKRKLTLIIFVFTTFIILLMSMNYFVMDTLSAVRAYVGGEAFWSKGQKDGIYFLTKYVASHKEQDYQLFLENLKIPLGDHLARLELQKASSPNYLLSDTGFIQGRNHPDDVRSMGLLFKRFGNVSYIKKITQIWTQGDIEIENLQIIGSEIHQLILKNEFNSERSDLYAYKIESLNSRLSKLEAQFSYTLGEAARWLTSTLFWVTFLIAISCLIFTLWISITIGREILKSIEALKLGTIRVEQGTLSPPIMLKSPLTSKNELNQLAISFNKMTESLKKAINERDVANERLEIRAAQLSKAQELAHIGNWEWDKLTNLVNASDEFYRIYGLDSDIPLTYEFLIQRVHPVDLERVEHSLAMSFSSGNSFTFDHKILRDDGDVRELSIQVKPILDDSNEVVKIIGSTQDLTDRLKIQSKMLQSSKMATLGEMASGIAHEINNPLAIIKLAAIQLQKNIEGENPNFQMALNSILRINTTITRISKIVQGLRTFSRDGRNDPIELVSVDDLIEDVLSFCNERLKNNSIELIRENIGDDLIFEGRKIEISQVLLNLLNNAIDAIKLFEEKWIHISAINEEHFLNLIITDSGRGVPLEKQHKIFEPFFTDKEIGKGTGLGLSLSLRIAKNHQGDLFLDTENFNTTFVLKLPKKQSVN